MPKYSSIEEIYINCKNQESGLWIFQAELKRLYKDIDERDRNKKQYGVSFNKVSNFTWADLIRLEAYVLMYTSSEEGAYAFPRGNLLELIEMMHKELKAKDSATMADLAAETAQKVQTAVSSLAAASPIKHLRRFLSSQHSSADITDSAVSSDASSDASSVGSSDQSDGSVVDPIVEKLSSQQGIDQVVHNLNENKADFNAAFMDCLDDIDKRSPIKIQQLFTEIEAVLDLIDKNNANLKSADLKSVDPTHLEYILKNTDALLKAREVRNDKGEVLFNSMQACKKDLSLGNMFKLGASDDLIAGGSSRRNNFATKIIENIYGPLMAKLDPNLHETFMSIQATHATFSQIRATFDTLAKDDEEKRKAILPFVLDGMRMGCKLPEDYKKELSMPCEMFIKTVTHSSHVKQTI